MKTYDCFIFYNELDLLELRLNTLNHCIDYFVIVEAAITFQGQKKGFLFEHNKDRFAEFIDKIIHFKVESYEIDFANLPYITEPKNADETVLNKIYKYIDECRYFDKKVEFWWGNDFFQRECIWRALAKANPAADDMILISDVDEIPNPEIVEGLKARSSPESLFCLRQHEFCYYLNYYHNSDWVGTCCFLYGSFNTVSLNAIRFSTKRDEGLSPQIIEDGGWHFTSIGNVEAIKNKIKNWSHREYNTLATLSSVEYHVKYGYDIFRRKGFGRLEYIPVTSSMLPAYLVSNVGNFERLIGPEIEEEPFFQWAYYGAYFYFRRKVAGLLRRLRAVTTALQTDRL